jgi:hypothetical protein
MCTRTRPRIYVSRVGFAPSPRMFAHAPDRPRVAGDSGIFDSMSLDQIIMTCIFKHFESERLHSKRTTQWHIH